MPQDEYVIVQTGITDALPTVALVFLGATLELIRLTAMSQDELSRVVKNLFRSRLLNRLYNELRSDSPVANWELTAIFRISETIVDDSEAEINRYLEAHFLPLNKADETIEYIIKNILMPKIQKLRL